MRFIAPPHVFSMLGPSCRTLIMATHHQMTLVTERRTYTCVSRISAIQCSLLIYFPLLESHTRYCKYTEMQLLHLARISHWLFLLFRISCDHEVSTVVTAVIFH